MQFVLLNICKVSLLVKFSLFRIFLSLCSILHFSFLNFKLEMIIILSQRVAIKLQDERTIDIDISTLYILFFDPLSTSFFFHRSYSHRRGRNGRSALEPMNFTINNKKSEGRRRLSGLEIVRGEE